MALDSKKVASFLKNAIVESSRFCYRFACAHPIISSLLCSFGLLYVVYPELFFFLVSSSPVLISTALLLGTLLSLGQPHIAHIDDLEEEEESVEASNKSYEDDDEKSKSKVDETTDDDYSQLGRTEDDTDAFVTGNLKRETSAARDVSETKISRRRFEEGIDDFSTRRYLDPETLLGRRTEIVETIEEGEEQFNGEDLDDDRDQSRNIAIGRSLDFKPIPTEEEEEIAETGNREAAVMDEPKGVVERDVDKVAEAMVPGDEMSEKSQERTAHEGVEGQGIQGTEKGEEPPMENQPKSIHFIDTMTEGLYQKPIKEIEEEMPLLDHPPKSVRFTDTKSITEGLDPKPTKEIEEENPLLDPLVSSSSKLQEEISDSSTLNNDSFEGVLKSKVSDNETEAKGEAEVSEKEEEKSQKASLEDLFSFSLQSSWKRFAHHHTFSDSGSDGAESSSADASLGDLGPMFDELHPLLDYEESKTVSVSDSYLEGSEGIHEEEFSPRDRTPEDLIVFLDEPQAPSDVHEEEEEEEDEEEEDEEGLHSDFGFTWTEDDEKNLRDLGFSERERMQQEEKVVALRHVQHHQGGQEENLIDFFSEERASLIEEENLVEIRFMGEENVKNPVEVQSYSIDCPVEARTDSAGKEKSAEVQSDSTSRQSIVEIQSDSAEQVQSDSVHKENAVDNQFQSLDKENPIESTEEKSSTDHAIENIQRDLLLQEDQSQLLEDVHPSEKQQEDANMKASPVEEFESTSRNVFVEDLASEHEEVQVGSPDLSLQTTERDSHVIETQRDCVSRVAEVPSVDEKQSKPEETEESCDMSFSSLSSEETESRIMQVSGEESTSKHEEIPVNFLKNSEQYIDTVDAIEQDSSSLMENQKEISPTIAQVALTEEHQWKEEKTEELSNELSFSASEEIESATGEVIAEEAAIIHEEVEVGSPKASLESTETVKAIELQRDSVPSIVDIASSEKQQAEEEKIEEFCEDSSSSTSEETESKTREIIEEQTASKHKEDEVDSHKSSQQFVGTAELIEHNSPQKIEMEIDGTVVEDVSTDEQPSKEEKIEEPFDDNSSSVSERVADPFDDSSSSKPEKIESTSREFIPEETAGKHEEAHLDPQVYQESTETIEAVELDSHPLVEMHGHGISTVEELPLTEAQESKAEETPLSDVSISSASAVSQSENQEGLIPLDVKSKEEIESAIKDVISEELGSKHEETQADVSISSESALSQSESQQGLILLEVKSEEEIESSIKDVIAEELGNKHEETQVAFSDANSEPTETVEPIQLDSTPEIHIPKESEPTVADVPLERQPIPEETEKTSDDSNSSPSDMSSPESLQELKILEVKYKEEIEAAFKEAIAEELARKHEDIQVASPQASQQSIETVEPIKPNSPPVMEMHRDVLPTDAEVAPTEEHESKPEKKTEESSNDLSSSAVDVRHSAPSDGGEVQ